MPAGPDSAYPTASIYREAMLPVVRAHPGIRDTRARLSPLPWLRADPDVRGTRLAPSLADH
jgi:hypothetical protein